MTKGITALATGAAVFASAAAFGGDAELTRPVQAASLHDPAIDMATGDTHRASMLEIVATYAERVAIDQSARTVMGLMHSDKVSFALPGVKGTQFTYSRAGDTVRVVAKTTRRPAEAVQ